MTSPISGVPTVAATLPPGTAAATTASTAGGAAKNSTDSLLDPKAFLQLLVAQLQYQDPSNPVDTSSFLNQTAMLSQVQTMTGMSDTLATLSSSQQIQAATGLIGKQVSYLDDSGATQKGVVSTATLSGGNATLLVGGSSVPLDKVVQVSAATTAPTS